MAHTEDAAQHTPRPWRIEDEHGHLVIRSDGGLIADIGPFNSWAYAKLIVTAPALLAALKGTRADLEDFADPDGEFDFTRQAARKMVTELNVAIEAAS